MMAAETVLLVSEWPAAVAAGTGESRYVTNVHPFDIRVTAAYVTAQATTAAHATNYTTLTVETSDDATVIATATSETVFTAATPRAMTISEVGSSAVIAQGGAFLVKKADSGTGAAFEGAVTLLCEPIRSA